MMSKKTRVVAAFTAACRLSWLLLSALVLPPALPAMALQAGDKGLDRSPDALLAQASAAADLGIPKEVQGWFDAAKAAAAKGDSAEALRLQKQVVAWLEDHPEVPALFRARALINLGTFLRDVGLKQQAPDPTERAVSELSKIAASGMESRRIQALALSNLGLFYSELGQLDEALTNTDQAVKLFRDLAKSNPSVVGDLALSLNNLGKTLRDLGRLEEALAPTLESLKIHLQLVGSNPALLGYVAGSLNNLGLFYTELGRRQEALLITEDAVKIFRKLAKTDPASQSNLALSLLNLGRALGDLGRHQEALATTKESLNIQLQLARSNPVFQGDLAKSLLNFGAYLSALGRYQEALGPTEELVKVYRELAKPNPLFLGELGRSLNNLGHIYSRLGRYQDALAPSQEALQIFVDLARANPAFLGDLALSLNNLGLLYGDLGRLQQAVPPSELALKLYRQLVQTNPAFAEHLARSSTNLALLQLQLANPSAALPLLRESVSTEVAYLQGQLPLLPEGRRLALVEVFGDRWQIPFSQVEQGEAGAALALFTRLNRQGLLQDIQRSQALLARSGPQRALVEQLTVVTAQLASTTLTPQQQKALLKRKEQVEQELYLMLPQVQPRLVQPSQIAALLPAGGLLVEFQRYRSVDNKISHFGPPRYLALLLRPDGTIRAIPLGEAAPIDAAVAAAVIASADANQQAEASAKLAAVSRLVLAPLQRELAGVRELFVSPDGELNRLPFAALPVAGAKEGGITDSPITADGQILGAAVALRLLTTGRDLLRLQQPARAGAAPVLIVNPDFNAASAAPSRGGQQRSPGLRGITAWQPLPGTEQEARKLAPLLGGSAVISGPAATATVVLGQRAPRILHIATHGFFLADQAPASGTATGARSGGTPFEGTAPAAPSQEDPLQRSGLVFAGANRPDANPSDDGYLTAAEATAMDLEGTELVTLSACETGLGGVRSGEGVYGLQRSLAVAGARATLLSLWKVDDNLTVAFMERYYNKLKAGQGRAEALRDTQAEFRDNKNSTYNDIRVWGAFQLSGDWRALPKW